MWLPIVPETCPHRQMASITRAAAGSKYWRLANLATVQLVKTDMHIPLSFFSTCQPHTTCHGMHCITNMFWQLNSDSHQSHCGCKSLDQNSGPFVTLLVVLTKFKQLKYVVTLSTISTGKQQYCFRLCYHQVPLKGLHQVFCQASGLTVAPMWPDVNRLVCHQ